MSQELTDRLQRCYSGAVFDVLRGRGVTDTVLPSEIVPLDPGLTVAGPVFTLRGRPAPGADPHATLLAWTEGTGWAHGGSLAWQLYDGAGHPIGPKGRAAGVPTWSFGAVVTQPHGFVVIY